MNRHCKIEFLNQLQCTDSKCCRCCSAQSTRSSKPTFELIHLLCPLTDDLFLPAIAFLFLASPALTGPLLLSIFWSAPLSISRVLSTSCVRPPVFFPPSNAFIFRSAIFVVAHAAQSLSVVSLLLRFYHAQVYEFLKAFALPAVSAPAVETIAASSAPHAFVQLL